ncbi:MAG: glycosyltransferase family 39 protein [Chloroflexi bacterium]|nr:glycosyltransferase family 39 protein [Chloroflexota bacterium]
MSKSPYLTFSPRDIATVLLIIGVAFAFRAIIIYERAAAPDNAGNFDPLPIGSDQSYYYWSIFGFRSGEFPPQAFYFQPGMSYFLIGLSYILNTTNLAVLRFAISALGAINCGLLYALVQLAFGNHAISAISSAILAIYPVIAFHDTDFTVVSPATVLLSLALFGALWMYRKPEQWLGALLIGLAIGAGLTMRPEVAVTSSLLMVYLTIIRWRARRSVVPFVLCSLVALAIVAPIAIHNIRGGASHLITPMGGAAIYNGFNRDASGVCIGTRADFTTRFDHFHFLRLDIQLEPARFVELILRKIGLFFSATEPGNNLDYTQSGENVSALLRMNPLDFRILIALTIFGVVAAWRRREPTLPFFLLACVGMFSMTMLLWIESRIRTPIVAAMIPLSAYGLVDIFRHCRQVSFWRRCAAILALLSIGFALSWWAENNLPRKVTLSSLPKGAQPLGAVYNQELHLVGYRIQDQYTHRGRFEPFRPYVVTLYWKLERPTQIDYSFSLKLVVAGEEVESFDHPIGFVNYPPLPTSKWQHGLIYVEHIGMSVRRFDVPTEVSGYLWLDVYPGRNASYLFDPAGSARPLTLARPAIVWGAGQFLTLNADSFEPIRFGDLLLQAWRLPESARGGQVVEVELGWRSTDRQIEESYSIGLYLRNEAGEFVANFDAPLRNGNLLTNSLPPNYRLQDQRSIRLPTAPGSYRVYVAVYSNATGARLPINAEGETLAQIGVIVVE